MTTPRSTDPRAARVEVHAGDRWVAAPIRLMEAGCGLSAEARLALIYLLGLGGRPNWTIYVQQVARALGYGNRRWPRVRKELEAAGYLWSECGHSESGDWRWVYHIFDTPRFDAGNDGATPDAPADPTALCVPADRGDAGCGPAAGGDRHSSTSHGSTGRRSIEQQHEDAPRAASAPAGAAAHRQQCVVHGVTCWTQEDREAVEELTMVHGVDAVHAAARQCRAEGIDPLPSAVARRLAEVARDQRTAEAEHAAEAAEVEQRQQRAATQAARDALRDDPATRAAASAAIDSMRRLLR